MKIYIFKVGKTNVHHNNILHFKKNNQLIDTGEPLLQLLII